MKTTTIDGVRYHDIANEEWREYDFGNGKIKHIDAPVLLHAKVSPTGADMHYVVDAEGHNHIVAPGWIGLRFKTKDGKPSFPFNGTESAITPTPE